jgi:WD40 repeat protein
LIADTVDNKAVCINPDSGFIRTQFECIGRAVACGCSPDGKRAVFAGDLYPPGSDTGFIHVFDLRTGASLVSTRCEAWVSKLVVTTDDRVFALCADSVIRVFNLNNLELLNSWLPHEGSFCNALVLNKKWGLIATGEYHDEERPAKIRIWNVNNEPYKVIKELHGPHYGVFSLAFSTDGMILVAGSNDLRNGVIAWSWLQGDSELNSIILFQKELTEQIRPVASKQGSIISTLATKDTVPGIAVFPNSTWVVAVEGSHLGQSDAINIFDVIGQEKAPSPKVTGHPSVPLAVDIDDQGLWIATVHAGGEIMLWPAEEMRKLPASSALPAMSDHSVDKNLKIILSLTHNDQVYVTNTESGESSPVQKGKISYRHRTLIAPSGRFFVSTYWEHMPIAPWTDYSGQEEEEFQRKWFEHFKATTPICCYIKNLNGSGNNQPEYKDAGWRMALNMLPVKIALSNDEKWGAILLQSPDEKRALFWLSLQSADAWRLDLSPEYPVGNIEFSPDGQHLMLIHQDEMSFFILESGAKQLPPRRTLYACPVFSKKEERIYGPFFVGNDTYLIAGLSGIVIYLELPHSQSTDQVNLQQLTAYQHDKQITGMCVSTDGKKLAISDFHPSVTILDLPTFQKYMWRPLDQICERVFWGDHNHHLLVIGQNEEIIGLNYSLMRLL